MEPFNTPKLFLVSLYLLISITSSKSNVSPAPQPDKSYHSPTASPGPQPDKSDHSPTASPGPQVGSSYKRLFPSVSLPPTSSDAPSEAPISPNAHAMSPHDEASISPNAHATSPHDNEASIFPNAHATSSHYDEDSVSQDLHATSSHDGPFNPQVKKICDSTDYPILCMATVIPLMKDKPNLESILGAAIKAGNEFAKNALALAKALGNKADIPPRLSSILKDCMDSYDTAVENYEKTINAFSEKDIGTMETMLSAVITDVSDCQDGFNGEDTDSPFSSFAEKLTNMTSNCLAIVSLMK